MHLEVILPNAATYQELSPADRTLRAKIEQEKRVKLQNPNYSVSTTRLCVRNVPRSFDDKQFRTWVLDWLRRRSEDASCPEKSMPGFADKKVQVKQAKLVRSKENKDPVTGKGKSRAYGYIEFAEHAHALCALRALNNNPSVCAAAEPGSKNRPIVYFAIENSFALQKLRRQQQQGASASLKRRSGQETDLKDGQTAGKEPRLRAKKRKGEDRKEAATAVQTPKTSQPPAGKKRKTDGDDQPAESGIKKGAKSTKKEAVPREQAKKKMKMDGAVIPSGTPKKPHAEPEPARARRSNAERSKPRPKVVPVPPRKLSKKDVRLDELVDTYRKTYFAEDDMSRWL